MPDRSAISWWAFAVLVCLGQASFTLSSYGADTPTAASPGSSARVAAGLGSAQQVLDLLEYMVVDLAGKKKSWEDNIFPNLDIFLIGVSTDQPIRFDLLFDPAHGARTQAIVPTENLKDFRMDNLDPIGIETRQDKSDKNLFECVGTVYNGWMRYLPTPTPYSVFFEEKEGLPAGMAHPETLHKALAEKQYIAFLNLQNTAAGAAERQAAFETYRVKADESFKKLSTETREQFEFRKATRGQTQAILKQWLVESALIELGAKLNKAEGGLPVSLNFSALPETPLARDLQSLKTKPSLFGGITAAENNVLTLRVNMPMNAERIPGMRKVYELAAPVLKDRIDQSTQATAGEKVALHEIVTLLLDVLTENLDSQSMLDGFLEVIPVKDKHAILMGVSATGEAKFNQMIEKIPAAQEGWSVEMNADKVGETAIHKLKFGKNPPKSLVDFYGDSNEAWIAVNSKSVWMAGGKGSLESLKGAIAKTTGDLPAATGVLAIAEMNARPIIQSIDAIFHDPELEILQQINLKGRRQERVKEGKPESANEDEKKPGARAAELANFVWIPTALAAMDGKPDRITLSLKLDEQGNLAGHSDAQVGVLKAIGALVAKFSDENLK